jgi:hypothetical protein
MWKGVCLKEPLTQLSNQELWDNVRNTNKIWGAQVDPDFKPVPTKTRYNVGLTVSHRPEFTVAQWDHIVNSQDDGLSENPCWPKDIAPLDPGFTLLTFDKYYDGKKLPYDYKQAYAAGTNGYDPATGAAGTVKRDLEFVEGMVGDDLNGTFTGH